MKQLFLNFLYAQLGYQSMRECPCPILWSFAPRFGTLLLSNQTHKASRALHNPFERPLCAFWGTHPGEANDPRQWANPELFEALGPSF